MAGVGVDVEFGFHTGGFVFEIKSGHAFGDVGAVAVAAGDEERGHAFLGVEEAGGAWVDEALEVGAAGLLFDGIGGVFLAGIVLHGGKGGEFAPSREAEDADAVGLDVPFGSTIANGADGTAGVGHGVILNGVGAAFFAGEAVFEHEGGDAVVAEPFGQSVTLMAKAKLRMTAAGADDDSGASGFVSGGDKWRDAGVMYVDDVAAFGFFRLGRTGFGARGAHGPEREGSRGVSVREDGSNENEEKDSWIHG